MEAGWGELDAVVGRDMVSGMGRGNWLEGCRGGLVSGLGGGNSLESCEGIG